MIRHIVAIDSTGGYAKVDVNRTTHIPWDLPIDTAYYKAKTKGKPLLMGHSTYNPSVANEATYNYVLTHDQSLNVINGEPISSTDQVIYAYHDEDLWVIGGSSVYGPTIQHAGELYITRVEGDFGCNRFYPTIPAQFVRMHVSPQQHENDITFHFEVYLNRELHK